MGKKGDTTKQRIRAAAFDLFAEYGYTRVTMQDICDKTGLSKGGLYRHYENKSQLFTDLLISLQGAEADRELEGMKMGLPAEQILEGYLNHIRQDLRKETPDLNIALYEFCIEQKDGEGADLLSGQLERGKAILRSLLEYGISEGTFHTEEAEGAAAAILFLAEGLRMAGEVMTIPEDTVTDVLEQIKRIVGIKHEK